MVCALELFETAHYSTSLVIKLRAAGNGAATDRRPVLDLAIKNDSRLRSALHAEVQLWHELDRVRLGV
jgi:hypothetical protein